MLIEILPGVYYDSEKEWYEQDPQLIELAETVMQGTPKDSETEISANKSRLLWGVWEHTTELGTFEMKVDFVYEYDISSRAFLSKARHDQVTIIEI